jgi:hypothetical protein
MIKFLAAKLNAYITRRSGMNNYNTVFGQMLALVSRSRFEKLVKEHKTEHGAKGFKSWT